MNVEAIFSDEKMYEAQMDKTQNEQILAKNINHYGEQGRCMKKEEQITTVLRFLHSNTF